MSLAQLADQLAAAADILREHAPRLASRSFVAAADKFVAAFEKFRAVLDGAAAGQSPEAQELARRLAGAFGSDEKALKAFAKKHAPPKGVSFGKADGPAARPEKAAAAIAAAGRAEAALAELRRRDAPSALSFDHTDDLALLRQVRRLGQLGADERALEGERLLREPDKLHLLARAVKLKVTAKSTPKTILKQLLGKGLLYAENVPRS